MTEEGATMMAAADDGVLARLAELENAVRRAGEALVRLRDENATLRTELRRVADENVQLKREASKLADERRQVLAQVDGLLRDIGKLDLD